MADATLTRGGTTVTLPLLGEGGGEPVVGHDIGKPQAGKSSKGAINPRWLDNWSRNETYTLRSRLTTASAFTTAITLADLIKSHTGGTAITLNIDIAEFDSDIQVVPAAGQDTALSLAYEPGRTDWVDVELSLTRINAIVAAGSQTASTPTASGTGPIQLTDGTTTVEFTENVVVDRSVGRPNSTVRRTPKEYPNYIDKRKAAYDAFELGVEFTNTASTQIADLKSIIRPARVRDAITLDFQGKYGLGAFDVAAAGSGSLRTVRPSAEAGTVIVPSLELRRVLV